MTLKKIGDKNIERYLIKAPFMESCKVPVGYEDIVSAVSSKLKDYCVFKERGKVISFGGSALGGPIPDRVWSGAIETENDYVIDVTVYQSYEQPIQRLSQARAELEYPDEIFEEDLNIIRDAFTSSGLERII